MAQVIPVVTRADPTAGRRTLTEGYLTQPILMGHGAWGNWRGVATFDFEGWTLQRGELNTGGYGEGYVDRRHPHAYVHELLAGNEIQRDAWAASIFAGRGFAPFGSDDPMTRPFLKFPVNHHLGQILERVVAIGAVRYGPVIGEFGTFNGDEPVSPGDPPNFGRFGDSWSTRLTLLPLPNFEVSGSYADVTSPEVRVGHGLDQRKSSAVARYSRSSADSWHYALAEFARTDERDPTMLVTRLTSFLGEGAVCRSGFTAAARWERTDRPEEEQLLDPFRTPRPATDLHNLGVSRWTTITGSLAVPAVSASIVRARPFVEVAHISVAPGSPPGLFSANERYGSRVMWMVSAGFRVATGMMHDRMGRYGAALPPAAMPGMSGMSGMPMNHTMSVTPRPDRCAR